MLDIGNQDCKHCAKVTACMQVKMVVLQMWSPVIMNHYRVKENA